MTPLILATTTLWQREMVRFFRQRNRVASAMISPVLLWLLLGSGLDSSWQLPGGAGGDDAAGYREYFYTGTLTMILLFTAIFSTITVIEDRREGFLQAVLAAPIHRIAIASGKIFGGACVAVAHAIVFLAMWPWVSSDPGWAVQWLGAAPLCLLVAVGLTALGLCVAWPMATTSGFHAVMMLFLMPMWFLSGAVFPMNAAPKWLAAIMWCNPMTYAQAALAAALGQGRITPMAPWQAVVATAGLTVLAVLLATALVARRPRR